MTTIRPPKAVRVLGCAAALLLGLAFEGRTLAAQITANPPLEIFHGFTLIDGLGGPPIPDAAISVRGNSIVTVGSRRELLSGPSAPRDAIVINLGGGYVIPGLVDAHVHLSTSPDRRNAEAELYRLLYSGVTAVRDMAGDARALAALARDSRLGEIEAPDVYFSALVAGPSFFTDPKPRSSAVGETPGEIPWLQAITPETDLVRAVARAKGTYATGLKIYADLSAEQVSALTEEAHRQGLRAWAHSMVFPARPLEVVESGVDVVSHVCSIAWEGMASAPDRYHNTDVPEYSAFQADSPVFTALFDEMRNRGTILDATLAMYSSANRNQEASPATPLQGCDVDFARALVREANAAGVSIAAGTDFTTPSSDDFPALYEELEALVTGAGLSPMQAIMAATSVGAEAIGVGATHGSLAHGRPVTFVLLRDDPLADIGNLRSVVAIWKNAVRYERGAYRSRFAADADAAVGTGATPGTATPGALLESWLGMWRRYDLDRVGDLFLRDDALTYFPSDREGLIEGFEAVRQYHEGIGFVAGGFQPEGELWLEQTTIADLDGSAVIGAVWYFGSRVDRQAAGRGPMTMVLTRTGAGFRISHLHFGNYAPEP